MAPRARHVWRLVPSLKSPKKPQKQGDTLLGRVPREKAPRGPEERHKMSTNGMAELAALGSIMIQNDDHSGIWSTNYFRTEHAAVYGLIFCSISARCFRLLLPASQAAAVSEMMTGDYCVVTRGYHRRAGRMMYEFMFEDESNSPFCIHIEEDALLGFRPDMKRDIMRSDLTLSIWLESEDKDHPVCAGSMLARFRAADLPCLKPWPVGGADDGAGEF